LEDTNFYPEEPEFDSSLRNVDYSRRHGPNEILDPPGPRYVNSSVGARGASGPTQEWTFDHPYQPSRREREEFKTSQYEDQFAARVRQPPPLEDNSEPPNRGYLRLQQRCAFLEKDNEELRGYIAEMRSAQGPVHDDGYYVQTADRLNLQIQSWVARNSKTISDPYIPDNLAREVFKFVERLGENGKKSLQSLTSDHSSLQMLYKYSRSRIAVIRHIIALFLFQSIFHPFAVGLDEGQSELQYKIQECIFSQGSFVYSYSLMGQSEKWRKY
jgi:hypothetical protein